MKYIVQDSENKKMTMEVISSIPQLPEGWQVLGLADDLPDALVEIEAEKSSEASKAADSQFLKDTDFKVLRNLREIKLGLTPTLSDTEMDALETLRDEAAARIST